VPEEQAVTPSETDDQAETPRIALRLGTAPGERFELDELRAAWPVLSLDERIAGFELLDREQATEFFLERAARGQAQIIQGLPPGERRLWIRLLPPDDAADALQEIPPEERGALIELLDPVARREVSALLAYAEDDAGGLMSPRFARVRPELTVDEALAYVRRQMREKLATSYYAYVLDGEQRLLGVLSVRELFAAESARVVRDVMQSEFISVPEDMDQEAVARVIAREDLAAVPVLDAGGHMKGVVTVDDIVDVVQEEATEDIQKIGGQAALEAPYLQTPLATMVRKRAGWLAVLLVGETLTASALGHYEAEIARAVVLALFVPIIISSGGNSGSQATTLIIRAMALGEVQLKHWWRIIRREVICGLALGVILAAIGMARILVWQAAFHTYGDHYLLMAMTVAISLVGVVLWGSLVGSMLPLLLRRAGFDPASASAPMIATVVDVTGLIIYFSVARSLLSGTLL
jgi:magnesium transporter